MRDLRVIAAVLLALTCTPAGARPSLPPVMYWAWDRNEDLRAIDADRAGVAVLAASMRIDDSGCHARMRRPDVKLPEGAFAWSVVRLDVVGATPTAEDAPRIAARILEAGLRPTARGVQLDFDSTLRQRNFHRALLVALRAQLPPELGLSMTALVSWCGADDWLSSLPPGTIDFAVPMAFQMGADASRVRTAIEEGRDLAAAACRDDLGLADAEPLVPGRRPRTTWWFSKSAWTEESVRAVAEASR